MARRQNKQQQNKQQQDAPQPTAKPAQVSGKGQRRAARLARRREAKFAEHAITIIDRNSEEERHDLETGGTYRVHFKHMVMAGKAPIGPSTTMRHALKKAHQYCRDRRR